MSPKIPKTLLNFMSTKKTFFIFLSATFLTLALSISFQSLLAAWTAPLASPPGCTAGNPGCDAPLNIGPLMQVKSGALWLNTNGISPYGLIIEKGNVGIGTTSPATKLAVDGMIYSGSGGFKFPDGTTQTTAAGGIFTQIDYTSISYTHYTDASNPPYTNGIYVSDDDIVNTYIQRFTYIAIDFGAGNEKIVYRLMLYILNSYARDNLRQGTFKGSNNSTNGIDGNWTTLTTLASLTWPAGWDKVDFVNITPYRWYKIDGTPNSNNTVLMEWALEGDSAGASYASQWLNGANGAIYYFGGNVGINTTTPSGAKLVVNGTIAATGGIMMGNYATKPTCDASSKGMLVFDTTNNKPYVCANSSIWKPLDSDFDHDGIIDWKDWDDNDPSKLDPNLTPENIKSGVIIFGVTGNYQGSGSGLVLAHTSNMKTFAVSWLAMSGNGGPGGCKLQYNKSGTWTDITSPATVNCDADTLSLGVTLPGDGWYAGNWNNTPVRLVRVSDGAAKGTFSPTLACSPVNGSSSPTPTKDEDCNGYWDNSVTQGYWGCVWIYGGAPCQGYTCEGLYCGGESSCGQTCCSNGYIATCGNKTYYEWTTYY